MSRSLHISVDALFDACAYENVRAAFDAHYVPRLQRAVRDCESSRSCRRARVNRVQRWDVHTAQCAPRCRERACYAS